MGRALPRRHLERHGLAPGTRCRPPHTRHVHHLLLHHHLLRRPRQFPLDSDDILIRVGPKEYTDQDVVLEIDAKKHGTEGASGDRIKSSNLEEWELGNPSVRIERSGPTGSGNYYSNVVFCVYEIGRVSDPHTPLGARPLRPHSSLLPRAAGTSTAKRRTTSGRSC